MIDYQAIEIAKKYLGIDKYPFTFSFEQGNNQASVTVTKKDNHITINYSELACCFYGLTLVKEHIDESSYAISRNRHFKYNGLMFDCSRNEVLNIKTIKDIILVSALMGLNRFMLYTEDVYEIEGEPYFGYLRGRYSKDELKEIVEYSNKFGVDIIPCIQTLSHLNQALRWSPYYPIADTQFTLNVEKEDIYVLIEKMIKTCRECFTSKYIHIGMDEAYDMGTSAFLKENRLIDKKTSFLKHLNRVVSICENNKFTPMMWVDMFFKTDPKAKPDWYDLVGYLDESIKKDIPNVELVYWNYYDDKTDRYNNNLKTSLDTGKNITFASGLIRWIGMVGNISPSIRKCSAGLKSAIKNNVSSVFATTWGDASSGSTAATLYTILALHSSFDYENGSIKETSNILKAVTGLSLKDWEKLELPNNLRGELLPFENPSVPFLFQDVLLGLFDTRVKYEYEEKYHEHYLTLKKMIKRSDKFGYVYKCYSSMCDFLSIKVSLGKRIREQYQNKDIDGLKESVLRIKKAIKKLDTFITDYHIQWNIENKTFGYEIQDGRFGYLKQRMNTAIELINKYINKEIDSIPELEENILPYNGAKDEDPHCYNVWSQIVSVGNNQ